VNTKADYGNWSSMELSKRRVRRVVALLLFLPVAAWAGGVVTNCTEADLRTAMDGGGLVTFACDGTITLSSSITNDLDVTLDGTGHQATISGGNAVRVFLVNTNATLTIRNLTIANGYASGGAGILNSGGTVNATNCTFSGSTASSTRSSNALGGAVLNRGVIQLWGCTFIGNQACVAAVSGYGGGNGYGGAINNSGTGAVDLCIFTGNAALGATGSAPGFGWAFPGQGEGGAIYNSGTLRVSRSVFAQDGATGGPGAADWGNGLALDPGAPGGSGLGGAIANYGILWLEGSTLEANSAIGGRGGKGANGYTMNYGQTGTPGAQGGAGGLGAGGGLSNSGTATAVNCTFAGNFGEGGGGGDGGAPGIGTYSSGPPGPPGAGGDGFGAVYSHGGALYPLHLTNCTLALNRANGGSGYSTGAAAGGIYGDGCLLVNTLLSANSGNCSGWLTDGGHNLSSDATCNFTNTGSMNNTGADLGPLADNGGPTLTMALLPGSPAIDAGNTSLAPATDQRGVPRPFSLAADIGAFEFWPTLRASPTGSDGIAVLASGISGQTCRLLASSDFLNWMPLATNQIGTNGTALFYDNYAPGSASRFYRLVTP
jgi:hypothetical protein